MNDSQKNLINSYSFGSIKINGKTYNEDLIVFPKRISSNWRRKEGHNLIPSDLEEVLSFNPEVLIVGTGESGVMKVPQSTRETIKEKGIGLIIEKTGTAYKIFNERNKENKKVVGAFHLTC